MLSAPLIHGIQHRIWLMDNELGAFGDDLEVRIGNKGSDLKDVTMLGVEPRHFEIHPHKWGSRGISHGAQAIMVGSDLGVDLGPGGRLSASDRVQIEFGQDCRHLDKIDVLRLQQERRLDLVLG